MDDLVQFLRDRLDEDEQLALAAGRATGGDNPDAVSTIHTQSDSDDEEAVAEHIARHDPARVLREVEAKRRIIEMHGQAHECVSYNWISKEIDPCMWVEADEACTTLRLLALPYADHADYREDWRP